MAVTVDQFLAAFREAWQDRMGRDHDALLTAYSNRTAWTECVLGHGETAESSFLHGVMDRLSQSPLTYKREWYTVDALFVSGETLHMLTGQDHYFTSRLDVLIEHEHGGSVEQEFWKLIHWRAPLKVLIMYDYWESAKKKKPKKAGWLIDKLEHLQAMLKSADGAFRENGETQYLFLVANREGKDMDPTWRWCCALGPDWTITAPVSLAMG